ncbi:Uncharacterised protein [Mycobacterium tuberculosis]|uniref:Uncharacterized protein n=1 Tax=Mycobacterium tuberculosis TaxID=1773 RepID=A0A655CVT7_MYCTX|nr:Uncharacterised protein [Mycobacterium tuberculosis]CKR99167.1 Uncharacterised protein [Mycobacterium tuberculosis]CNU32669.1 Uncharacterised protein [Mycobacterium tuberculosis]CNU40991.1 Uncharacterised protein [Mycobacterium tuberculosis]CNU54135.1 Uncharacterised protein [Mycobacterium tuberculosis]
MPGHRQGPDPRRRPPAGPVCGLRGPRRCGRHEGAGQPAGHVLDAADHAGLHRNRGAAGGFGASGWPLRDQLGELRGRRRPGIALCQDHGAGRRARRGGGRADHRRRGPGPHRAEEGRDRRAADQRHHRQLGRRRIIHPHRHLDVHHRHRSGGVPPRRHRDHRGDPRTEKAPPGCADHTWSVQHLVWSQSRSAPGAQLGVPARMPRSGAGFGDRARVEDPADEPDSRGATQRRPGSGLRPPPRGLRSAAGADAAVRRRVGGLLERGPTG